MIILQSTDSISLVTSAAASIDVHATWIDNLAGAITPGRTNTATISGAATTGIVGSPASSTYRNVKSLIIRNRHASVSCDVTVKHTDGSNNLELIKTTLLPGQELVYMDGRGFVQHLATGAIISSPDWSQVTITGGTIAGTDITTKAGTTSAAGLHFPTGVLKTSPVAGDLEYDGKIFYLDTGTGERGVNIGEQIMALTATYTLANQTAAQKAFNGSTNGAINILANGTYLFDWLFDLSSMSVSNGGFGIAFSGTVGVGAGRWATLGNKATLATAAAPQSTFNNASISNTAIVALSTATVGWARVWGIFRFTTAGTFIPQISLGVAAAAVVGRDSYFRIWPCGSDTMVSVGNWT